MLILKDPDGGKVLISPRYFVAAEVGPDGVLTHVHTTAGKFIVQDTVDEIIEAIKTSVRKVLVD